MKPIELIFQGLTRRHHAGVVNEICEVDELRAILINVAFVNSSGVALTEPAITPHRAKTKVWVGVRNDITSWQGLSALLPLVRELYIVDTGIRHRIFHPKVYLSIGDTEARLAVGSANLTTGGLSQNIEASVLLQLDLEDADHAKVVSDFEALLASLAREFPAHVRRIRRLAELDELLKAGIIVDETANYAPRPATSRDMSARTEDPTPRMSLNGGPFPPRRARVAAPARPGAGRVRTPAMAGAILLPTGGARPSGFELIWQSGSLTRRDLNIPIGTNTNETGSMLFKKGEWEGIDQKHYFFDEAFNALAWMPDSRRPHILRADAEVELIIKNISYGVHTLRLTHNSATTSRSYQQNNSMTQVSWGVVKPYVARPDLLDRKLYLYRNMPDPTRFIIEID